MLNRRHFLARAGLAAAALQMPRIVVAQAATDRRFVFIIQRGAADGLSILMPTGDPAFGPARGRLAIPGGTKLDGMFTLHPALVETAKLFTAKEALFAHAVASPYRDRSHFDAQRVLETGGSSPYKLGDGWLNRLLTQIPRQNAGAIALSATVPLALRGKVDVASYAPSALPQASEDLLARVGLLYQDDAQLRPLWSSAMATRGQTGNLAETGHANAAAMGTLAGKLLTGPGSARVAMIETGGWDTHSAQASRLAARLEALDAMVGAMKAQLGPAWNDTLVLVATEFGRTVAVNGTGGTDHGTGAAAMLIGGAVSGGRILADWPGLAPGNLYEGRDLKPTLGLDTLIAGALGQHYGLDPALLARALFPDTPFVKHGERFIRG